MTCILDIYLIYMKKVGKDQEKIFQFNITELLLGIKRRLLNLEKEARENLEEYTDEKAKKE